MKKILLSLSLLIPLFISSCDDDEWTDSCGVVNGNNACLGCDNVPNSGLVNDACGVCDGTGYADDCGVCDDDTNNDNSTCAQDCAGEWGGSAANDDCGVCNGPGIDENCECDGTPHPDYLSLWGSCYYKLGTGLTIGLYGEQLGTIPPEIGQLTSLVTLQLENCGLTGSIPPEIGNLTNLGSLYLDGNQLSGSIPSEIGDLTSLVQLDIQDNQLTGSIPSEIGQLTNLEVLRLNENQLSGSIPSEIGDLPLGIIRLHDNNLTGVVPNSICQLPLSSAGGWASSIDDPYNWDSTIFNNSLCPQYPSCIEDYTGTQDTSNCP